MAGSYNRVLLMGNLTRDVEVKYLPAREGREDNQVASFGLAVNRKFRGRDGQLQDDVTFVDCEAWGKTAENLGKFFSKGRPIFVEGRLKLDQWEDKDGGGKRSKLRVVVENFQFVDSKTDGGGGEGGEGPRSSGRGAKAGAGAAKSSSVEHTPVDEDDIPF